MAETVEMIDETEPNYVAFRAAGQDFCVDIMAVREIRGWTPVTALPRAPECILGVINLRGSVVPILDFSVRLGFPASRPTDRNVVIIVRVGDRTVGLYVDEVSEILSMTPFSVKQTPDVGLRKGEGFVVGVIEVEDRLISLVNTDLLFPPADRGVAVPDSGPPGPG